MKEIVFAAAARKADQKTIENGTPSRLLMERAARGILKSCQWQGRIAVVCGGGNNGGDGYALAALLLREGQDVTVVALADAHTEDCAAWRRVCADERVRILGYERGCLSGFDMIADCIFGIGLRSEPEGVYAQAIREINESGSFVVSADIPSGLDADSGMSGVCVRADVTAAIGYLKTGEVLNMARDMTGELKVVDIGVHTDEITAHLVGAEDFSSVIRARDHYCNKGSFGTVALIGGSLNYTGAAKLANLALSALRAGCGISRLCVPASLASSVAPYLLESTMLAIPDKDGWMLFDPDAFERALNGTRAAAVGMGWGNGPDHERIIQYLLSSYEGVLIVDADALNALSRTDLSALKQKKCRAVLTPHPGEFARLTGKSISEILHDPIRTAEEFAARYDVTVLLKGTATVVTDGVNTYLCNRGCPGMATAGSGDVLSGILCGLFGYSKESLALTAACGAYIAGAAAEIAQEKKNAVSMVSSDTVSHISDAVGVILKANGRNCEL